MVLKPSLPLCGHRQVLTTLPQFPYLQNKNNYTYLPHRNLVQHCLASAHLFRLWTKLRSNFEHLHKLKPRVKTASLKQLAKAARRQDPRGKNAVCAAAAFAKSCFVTCEHSRPASSRTTNSPIQDAALTKSQRCRASARSHGPGAATAAYSRRCSPSEGHGSPAVTGGQPGSAAKPVPQACPHAARPLPAASTGARLRCSRRSPATPNRRGVEGRGGGGEGKARSVAARPPFGARAGAGAAGAARRGRSAGAAPAAQPGDPPYPPPPSRPPTGIPPPPPSGLSPGNRLGWEDGGSGRLPGARGVAERGRGGASPPPAAPLPLAPGARGGGSGPRGRRRRRRGAGPGRPLALTCHQQQPPPPSGRASAGRRRAGAGSGGEGWGVSAGAGASRSCRAFR